jgi:hypothetical protein
MEHDLAKVVNMKLILGSFLAAIRFEDKLS